MKKIIFYTAILLCVSCTNSTKNTVESNVFTDERREAIINQSLKTFQHLQYDSMSEDSLLAELSQLRDTLLNAVVNDPNVYFRSTLRALAYIHYKAAIEQDTTLPITEVRKDALLKSQLSDVMYYWYIGNDNQDSLLMEIEFPIDDDNLILAEIYWNKEEAIPPTFSFYVPHEICPDVSDFSVTFANTLTEPLGVIDQITSRQIYNVSDEIQTCFVLDLRNALDRICKSDVMIVQYNKNSDGFMHNFYHFKEKHLDRLVELCDSVYPDKANPIGDDISSKMGQPIKQVINRTTGEVIDLDSTWYLDTVWSEAQNAYILQMKQR